MNKYNKDLDKIKATEEFKRKTKAMLIDELNKNNKKQINEKPIKEAENNEREIDKYEGKAKNNGNKKSLAIAAVLIIVIGGTIWFKYISQEKTIAKNPVNIGEENNNPKTEKDKIEEESDNPGNNGSNKNQEPTEFVPRKDLPVLALDYNNIKGGMGYAALMAYDFEELENGSPVFEGEVLNHLPVFENIGRLDERGNPTGGLAIPMEEMKEIAADIANKLGYTIESYEDYFKGISAKGTEVEIIAFSDGDVVINFLTPSKLPENISFGYGDKVKTLKEAKDATEYLMNKYKDVIGLKAPVLATSGDYNFDGETRTWHYNCYEGDGDLTSDILNYNFRKVQFCPDDFGNLISIGISSKDLSKELGDYPIISKEEATKLLTQGNYSTTVPEAFPGEEYIKKVEITYNSDMFNEVLMPFYRFYVEVPALQQENGLKTYGMYDVPAVEGSYLKELPKAEIKFN